MFKKTPFLSYCPLFVNSEMKFIMSFSYLAERLLIWHIIGDRDDRTVSSSSKDNIKANSGLWCGSGYSFIEENNCDVAQ